MRTDDINAVTKCISLHAPWSTLWVRGPKIHETRNWDLKHHRGWLAVHAAKYWTDYYRELSLRQPYFGALFPQCKTRGETLTRHELWPVRGAIVGLVYVDASMPTSDPLLRVFLATHPHESEFGDFGPDRFAWRRTEHREFIDPIPFRGQQGLFTLPPDITALLGSRPYHKPDESSK